jgi:hypothetical protein
MNPTTRHHHQDRHYGDYGSLESDFGSVDSKTDEDPIFEVRVDWQRCARFRALGDAIEAAKIKMREHPHSNISVADITTGQIVVEIDIWQ